MKNIHLRVAGLALISIVLGCSNAAMPGDTGPDAGDATISDGSSDVNATDAIGSDANPLDANRADAASCPADLASAIGMACATEGQSCGTCGNPCQFCNLIRCSGGHWMPVEVFPMPCDAGADAARDVSTDAASTDVQRADTMGLPCGTVTCGNTEVCVHSVTTGGICRPVPDSGICGASERRTGDCCVFFSEHYQCGVRPAACSGGELSCGCAMSLCGAGPGSCPCQSASASTLECACLLP